MREGDAVGAVGIKGLSFGLADRALGRIPDVSDPYFFFGSRGSFFYIFVKDMRDESYPLFDVYFAVGLQGGDTCRILTAVLEIGECRDQFVANIVFCVSGYFGTNAHNSTHGMMY